MNDVIIFFKLLNPKTRRLVKQFKCTVNAYDVSNHWVYLWLKEFDFNLAEATKGWYEVGTVFNMFWRDT